MTIRKHSHTVTVRRVCTAFVNLVLAESKKKNVDLKKYKQPVNTVGGWEKKRSFFVKTLSGCVFWICQAP